MDTQFATKQFDEVLDTAQNQSPEVGQLLQEWEGKSIEECVIAAREVLYEGYTPILRDTLEPEQIPVSHAVFEAVFTKAMQGTHSRGRSRSGSSS